MPKGKGQGFRVTTSSASSSWRLGDEEALWATCEYFSLKWEWDANFFFLADGQRCSHSCPLNNFLFERGGCPPCPLVPTPLKSMGISREQKSIHPDFGNEWVRCTESYPIIRRIHLHPTSPLNVYSKTWFAPAAYRCWGHEERDKVKLPGFNWKKNPWSMPLKWMIYGLNRGGILSAKMLTTDHSRLPEIQSKKQSTPTIEVLRSLCPRFRREDMADWVVSCEIVPMPWSFKATPNYRCDHI